MDVSHWEGQAILGLANVFSQQVSCLTKLSMWEGWFDFWGIWLWIPVLTSWQ